MKVTSSQKHKSELYQRANSYYKIQYSQSNTVITLTLVIHLFLHWAIQWVKRLKFTDL
ncbi:hypothetical protein EJ02DRAFT_419628 [Clathrospora elynae]|uniref:Uncharacterized protein n=1 Tax=Clathrospora elynae TaxID=706981 RepID=A0A6A5SZL8_9PLEO|nr:hypothetical protein EJ02DRAFT_419628 [Clathrospora elynae]